MVKIDPEFVSRMIRYLVYCGIFMVAMLVAVVIAQNQGAP